MWNQTNKKQINVTTYMYDVYIGKKQSLTQLYLYKDFCFYTLTDTLIVYCKSVYMNESSVALFVCYFNPLLSNTYVINAFILAHCKNTHILTLLV